MLEALTSVAHAILVTVQRGARRMRCVGVNERRVVLDLLDLGPSTICTICDLDNSHILDRKHSTTKC